MKKMTQENGLFSSFFFSLRRGRERSRMQGPPEDLFPQGAAAMARSDLRLYQPDEEPTNAPEELERFRPVLLRKASRLLAPLPWLRSKCEPADLVQDTFLSAHRSQEQGQGASRGKRLTWLLSILRNRLSDLRSWFTSDKRNAIREISAPSPTNDHQPESLEELLQQLPTPDPTPSSQCRRNEEAAELAQALTRLPALDRDVLLWKVRDGKTMEEVATLLGIPTHSARHIYERALNTLRRLLSIRVV
jgi:RNA polymerase sigma-70 factor (subfamily 1)